MKSLKKCFALCALGLLVVSCNDDNPWSNVDGTGKIRPLITADTRVTDVVATRAEQEIEAPNTADFSISLEKSDGTYSKKWEKASLFPQTGDFSAGTYTMTVKYGDIAQEGFEKPCFIGTSSLVVRPEETTDVAVTASLANAMVSVEYTDNFKQTFKAYTSTFHTEGYGYNAILQSETRPLFIAPGKVSFTLDFTKYNGQGATVQPAEFTAEARHHYHIVLDTSGTAENASLEIKFDDSIVEEDVEILLSDELLNSPAPILEASGFTNGETIDILRGDMPETPVKFNFFVDGGLTGATFTVQSEEFNFSMGSNGEVNLVGLSEPQQAIATNYGIKCAGIYKNPDKMAFVDITSLINKLPVGTHTFTMVAKDQLTRVSDPVSLTVVVSEVVLAMEEGAVFSLGDREANIIVDYNGNNLRDNIEVKVMNDAGRYVATEIKNVQAYNGKPGKRAPAATKRYKVTIAIPEVSRDLHVKVYFKGEPEPEQESGTIKCQLPEYDAEVDAFASQAIIKINPKEAEYKNYIVENARVFVAAPTRVTRADSYSIVRDADKGYIYVKGLSPATNYTISTTLDTTVTNPNLATSDDVTTETILAVPNGDFEDLTSEFSGTINQGGKYSRTMLGSANGQNTQEFAVSKPANWATTNPKTYNASSTSNSWFKTFSVFNSTLTFITHEAKIAGLGGNTFNKLECYNQTAQNGNNAMVLRNVGWSTGGSVPGDHKNSAATPGNSYYNKNTPDGLSTAAGKLFLGSYSYASGSETFNEGIDFASRPVSLSFYYKYATDSQDTSENGTVTVQLLNGSTVIGEGKANLGSQSDFGQKTVTITYNTLFKKATSLRILFCSSDREESAIKVTKRANYLQEAYGAVLVVDNLTFNY